MVNEVFSSSKAAVCTTARVVRACLISKSSDIKKNPVMLVQLIQVFSAWNWISDIPRKKSIASLTISPELLHSPLHTSDIGKVAASAGPMLSNALCFFLCSEGEVTRGFFFFCCFDCLFLLRKLNFMKFILIDWTLCAKQMVIVFLVLSIN